MPGHASRSRVAPGFVGKPVKPFKQRKRVKPGFNSNTDNDARKAWRSGAPHQAEFQLLAHYDPAKDTGALDALDYIALATKTHFILRKAKGHNFWVVQIWGTPDNSSRAKQQLEDFSIDRKAHRQDKPIGGRVLKWEDAELEHQRLQKKRAQQEYLKKLSSDDVKDQKFAYSYLLPWQDNRSQVESILGAHLEALDDIRMDCSCYIEFDGQTSGFIIVGNERKKLKKAIKRLQIMSLQVLAQQSDPTQTFLFKPFPGILDYSQYNVSQKDYSLSRYIVPQHAKIADEKPMGKILTLQPTGKSDGEELDDDCAYLTRLSDLDETGTVFMGLTHTLHINQQYLHLWTTEALQQLMYLSGHIKMEVSIGCCVFQRYKNEDLLPLDEVEDFLRDANNAEQELEAYASRDLGSTRSNAQLLMRFLDSPSQLFLCDGSLPSTTTLATQPQVPKPRCKASFVLSKKQHTSATEGPSHQRMRLEMEFKFNESDEINEDSRRWMKVDHGDTDPVPYLDVHVLDLHDTHASQNLKITRCGLVNGAQAHKLPPAFESFAKEVHLLGAEVCNLSQNRKIFRIQGLDQGSPINLEYFEQSRSWHFAVAHTGYVAELSVVQQVDVKQNVPWPRDGRWQLRVFHEQWDRLFRQNESLGVGQKASWSPTEAQFFPPQDLLDHFETEGTEAEVGGGFAELFRVLDIVQGVANGVYAAQPDYAAIVDEHHKQLLRSKNAIGAPSTGRTKTINKENDISNGTTETPGDIEVKRDQAVLSHLLPVDDDSDHGLEEDENKVKKVRLKTAAAKRNAVLAALEKPKSSGDIRVAASRNFSSIEDILYGPPQKTTQADSNAKPNTVGSTGNKKKKKKGKGKKHGQGNGQGGSSSFAGARLPKAQVETDNAKARIAAAATDPSNPEETHRQVPAQAPIKPEDSRVTFKMGPKYSQHDLLAMRPVSGGPEPSWTDRARGRDLIPMATGENTTTNPGRSWAKMAARPGTSTTISENEFPQLGAAKHRHR